MIAKINIVLCFQLQGNAVQPVVLEELAMFDEDEKAILMENFNRISNALNSNIRRLNQLQLVCNDIK